MTRQRSDEFSELLRSGGYLFHFHTDWTDGKNSLSDYCMTAERCGFRALVLLEHIRRTPSYDVNALLRTAHNCQKYYELAMFVGLEAKVLPDGSVDIKKEVLPMIQVLGIAEHSFLGDVCALANALICAFHTLAESGIPVVWVHPGLRLLASNDPDARSRFEEVLNCALQVGAYIEMNLRYGLPPQPLQQLVPLSKVVVGLDAHCTEDVEKMARRALLWQQRVREYEDR